MVKKRYLLLAGLIALCGLLAFHLFPTGEQSRIREQVENLRGVILKDGHETEFAAGIKAKKIRRMFAGPCRIEAGVYGISRSYESGEIGPSIIAARQPYNRIGIDLHDLQIADMDQDRAVVRFTVSLGLAPYAGLPMNDTHEIVCRMEKDPDGWRFSEIRTVEVLEK